MTGRRGLCFQPSMSPERMETDDLWLGIVGDFGVYHVAPSGVALNTYTFLFGPRLTFRNPTKVNPFLQGLVGGSRLSAGYGQFGRFQSVGVWFWRWCRYRYGSPHRLASASGLRRSAQLEPNHQLHAGVARDGPPSLMPPRGNALAADTRRLPRKAWLRVLQISALRRKEHAFPSCAQDASSLNQGATSSISVSAFSSLFAGFLSPKLSPL